MVCLRVALSALWLGALRFASELREEIGLGVLEERVERDFASEFGERDTSLGADAEIFVRELSADLTGEHL